MVVAASLAGREGSVGGDGLGGVAGCGLAGCGLGTSATFIAAGSLSSALPATLLPDCSLPSGCSASWKLEIPVGEIRKAAATATWSRQETT
ncbi:hypothetical protein, partial [Mesorhizobium sp. M7A.F.Ca.CA.002.05.1.1]|uniref:hypothetical protein n=1 Tax=Mesorhizobium sp. M7A.F.Ca.CA.002.05.1.1 TaxID=2496704 RepID=UPI001FE16C87